jgi:hypothetical protein
VAASIPVTNNHVEPRRTRGTRRAEYGKQVLETLSEQLLIKYGKGYSVANLKNFRQFYLVFPDRMEIRHPAGSELPDAEIQREKKLIEAAIEEACENDNQEGDA